MCFPGPSSAREIAAARVRKKGGPIRSLPSDYCFGFEPSVERLLSGLALFAEPGMSFEAPELLVPIDVPVFAAPDVPAEVPLALEPLST